jgi:hypothetical protein
MPSGLLVSSLQDASRLAHLRYEGGLDTMLNALVADTARVVNLRSSTLFRKRTATTGNIIFLATDFSSHESAITLSYETIEPAFTCAR